MCYLLDMAIAFVIYFISLLVFIAKYVCSVVIYGFVTSFNLEYTSEECLSFFICGGYEVVLDRANLTEFIFSYLWCSGMGPDFRVLVRKSRKQAEQYHRLYKVPLWSPLLFIFFPPSMVFTLYKFWIFIHLYLSM